MRKLPSLRDIEKAMYSVWMNEESRDWLDDGAPASSCPEVLKKVDGQILKELDRKGAAVYARSIRYEHKALLERIFPHCATLAADYFDELVCRYYQNYPSRHFDLHQICKDFPAYLAESEASLLKKYPYMPELADYEWLELEKLEDKRAIVYGERLELKELAQLQQYAPVVNQTLCLRKYSYPVPDIAANFRDKKRPKKKFAAKACSVAIYRDPQSDDARFIELGPALAAVVEAAISDKGSYQELLKLAIELIPEKDPAQVVLEFLELIDELQDDRIFVGSIKLEH